MMKTCIGFDWNRINFIHSSCFGFVLETGMFLLQSRAYSEPRPLLFLTLPQQWEGWGCTRVGREQSEDSWPQVTEEIPYTAGHHPQHIDVEEGWCQAAAWGLAATRQLVSNCFHLHCLSFLNFTSPCYFLLN